MQILKVGLIKGCWVSNYVFRRLLCSNKNVLWELILAKSMPHKLYYNQQQSSKKVLFQLETILWF